MCTGLEIAGLLATAAGTGLGIAGAEQSKSAMRSKMAAEAERQAQYAKEAQAKLQESIRASTPEERAKQKEAGTQAALQEYQKVQAIPLSISTAADVGPIKANVVDTTVKAQRGLSNAAAAPMQGWDEATLQQWLKDLQAKSALGQISSRAQASANVLPIEMQAAQHKGDALSGIGSLLGTAGGLMGLYGAVKAPATAAAAKAANLGTYGRIMSPFAGTAAKLGVSGYGGPSLGGNSVWSLGY